MANVPYLCMDKKNNTMNAENIVALQEHFRGVDMVTLDNIKSYLGKNNTFITDVTLRKAIYKLKQKGLIISIKRGVYSFKSKTVFLPSPDKNMFKIYDLFKEKYPLISCCIWSTQWLHQFMNLQPFQYIYVFETEKNLLEPTFFLFKENNINAFLKPDQNLAEKYMAESQEPVVVKLITTRSTVIRSGKMDMASIEKILVDVFCDLDIFFFYQGNELRNIYNNVFRSFHINYSKLLNYAERRKQKEKIVHYLKTQIEYANKELIA